MDQRQLGLWASNPIIKEVSKWALREHAIAYADISKFTASRIIGQYPDCDLGQLLLLLNNGDVDPAAAMEIMGSFGATADSLERFSQSYSEAQKYGFVGNVKMSALLHILLDGYHEVNPFFLQRIGMQKGATSPKSMGDLKFKLDQALYVESLVPRIHEMGELDVRAVCKKYSLIVPANIFSHKVNQAALVGDNEALKPEIFAMLMRVGKYLNLRLLDFHIDFAEKGWTSSLIQSIGIDRSIELVSTKLDVPTARPFLEAGYTPKEITKVVAAGITFSETQSVPRSWVIEWANKAQADRIAEKARHAH